MARAIPIYATLALAAWLTWPAAAPAASTDELRCLALNIYWEARPDLPADQLAVAYVTLNRVRHDAFPNSICEVAHEGGEEVLHKCQFSWWCDGRPDQPRNAAAWRQAQEVARQAMRGSRPDPTGGALYFHNGSVSPAWAAEKERTVEIGDHVFYR